MKTGYMCRIIIYPPDLSLNHIKSTEMNRHPHDVIAKVNQSQRDHESTEKSCNLFIYREWSTKWPSEKTKIPKNLERTTNRSKNGWRKEQGEGDSGGGATQPMLTAVQFAGF